MSTDITIYAAPLPDRLQYAEALAASNLLPSSYRQNPANVLLAIELGSALGIPPIQAINGIHVIEGKPTASADLIASLVRKAGHKLRITGDDTAATATLIRADDPEFPFEVTWTIKRAQAAGLTGKGVWKAYPAAMLKARAITEVARAGASDALYGVIYTSEELERTEPAPAARPTLAAAIAQHNPTSEPEPAPEPEAIDAEVIDEPEGEPLRTNAQARALWAGLRDMGLTERETALEWLSELLGRDVESTSTLTVGEASRILDYLNGEPQDAEVVA